MLDIDEEHLAGEREGRAGEFGIVHASKQSKSRGAAIGVRLLPTDHVV